MSTTFEQSTGRSAWTIDQAHSNVGFAVRHMMITTVKGRFEAFEGEIAIDEQDVTRSRLDVRIDAASVDTRNDQRDAHLRSGDFFDAENHPWITFTSRRVRALAEGRLEVTGDLTIRGVTREVVLSVEEEGRGTDPWGAERVGYTATARIDRTHFGLTWNQALETGGVLVANDIRINLDIQLVREG
jgi:polyisoprenoid-binding protein YceI